MSRQKEHSTCLDEVYNHVTVSEASISKPGSFDFGAPCQEGWRTGRSMIHLPSHSKKHHQEERDLKKGEVGDRNNEEFREVPEHEGLDREELAG